MAKRNKLKAAKVEGATRAAVHDRKSIVLPAHANVAVIREDDAFGFPSGAQWDQLRGEWIVPQREVAELIVSLRDDPLRQMLVRDQITRLQYEGGRWYERRFEAQLGAAKAIDPSKDAVDGGKLADPLTMFVTEAIQDLKRARTALGLEGDLICQGIIGKGLTIGQFAVSRGMDTRTEIEYIGRRFRECLVTLAGLAGLIRVPSPDTAYCRLSA